METNSFDQQDDFSSLLSILTGSKNNDIFHKTIPIIDEISEENSAALLGYNVYRSTSASGTYTRIAQNVNRQYYRDESAANGQNYYYKVTAVYSEGESNYSNRVNASATSNGYTIESGWANV